MDFLIHFIRRHCSVYPALCVCKHPLFVEMNGETLGSGKTLYVHSTVGRKYNGMNEIRQPKVRTLKCHLKDRQALARALSLKSIGLAEVVNFGACSKVPLQ